MYPTGVWRHGRDYYSHELLTAALAATVEVLLDPRMSEEHMRAMWGLVGLQEGEWPAL